MYLQKVNIINYGVIENLEYTPKFNEDGTPKPIVFVGKNGSGKTLLLSNIIHSLIELKRTTGEELREVEKDKYYRVGSKTYIKNGKNHSYIHYSYTDNKNFTDLVVNDFEVFKNEEFNDQKYYGIDLNDEKLRKNGFYNKLDSVDTNVFDNNVFIYFPVDRYYQPAWINTDNDKLAFNSNSTKLLGKSNVNMIKNDVITDIQQWILDVIMDKLIFEQKIIDLPPETLPNGTQRINEIVTHIGKNNDIHNNINRILTMIYKAKDNSILSARFGLSQKDYRKISIHTKFVTGTEVESAPSFSHLSSGEIMVFSIFASILKEFDRINIGGQKNINDITGVVVIDEIDLHMHSDFEKNVLPEIIDLFKGIQFIITSHSPFFLLGMRDKFKDKCEFVNLPTGAILSNVENFEEIRKCYNLIDSDFEQLRVELSNINEKLKTISKPHIITEGKTDWKHFKYALSKFKEQGKFTDLDVNFEEYETLEMGDSKLETLLKNLAKIGHTNKIIGIFDSDESVGKKYDKEVAHKFGNNVYGCCISKPDFRQSMNGICVEFLYKNQDIFRKDENGRRLFLTNEFNNKGRHKVENGIRVLNYNSIKDYIDESNCKIKDSEIFDEFDNSIALSKNDFAENIINMMPNFINIDLAAFEPIFERIRLILNE